MTGAEEQAPTVALHASRTAAPRTTPPAASLAGPVPTTRSGGLLRTLSTTGDGGWTEQREPLHPGRTVTVGRNGMLRLGHQTRDGDDDGSDRKLSREGLSVRLLPAGWQVTATNANGAVLHRWGQPAEPVPLGVTLEPMLWPRVAVRLLGSPGRTYWVLLETDVPWAGLTVGSGPADGTRTEVVRPPNPLTPAQLEVVRLLFHDALQWPPALPGQVRQLGQVGRRIGRSAGAVQERLKEVREKARRVGLSRDVPLDDPEYVYVLVRAGYLTVDNALTRPP